MYISYPNLARPQSAARMFTTLAARAAYTARAQQPQHTRPSSSTCVHARRATLSPPRAFASWSRSRAQPCRPLERARVQRAPRTATVAHGLPIPIIGGLFNAPLMTIIYVFVAIKMYLGYDRTTFGSGVPKVVMVGLWPVLSILSASFRENLKRAM